MPIYKRNVVCVAEMSEQNPLFRNEANHCVVLGVPHFLLNFTDLGRFDIPNPGWFDKISCFLWKTDWGSFSVLLRTSLVDTKFRQTFP